MREPLRILAVTPNPSLDLLFPVHDLVWNDANRLANPRMRPGGQGINLARAAAALGARALAVAPLGGRIGALLREMLEPEALLRAVPIRGDTRVFVEARDIGAGALPLNPRGPTLSPEEAAALELAVADAIEAWRPDFVACCGSLSPGLPVEFYAGIAEITSRGDAAFVVDCDGEALRAAAPTAAVLAPNRHEAARLLGMRIESVADAAAAALRLGTDWSAVTLGAEGGVLAVGGRAWACRPPPLPRAGSAVGAGDAFLAALLVAIGDGLDPARALAAATAGGAATLVRDGATMIEAEEAKALLRHVEAVPL